MKAAWAVLVLANVLLGQRPDLDPPKASKHEAVIWLDAAKVKVWNHAGRGIPHAPRGAELDSQCMKNRYRGETDEERAVEKAGWFLVNKGVDHNGILVVAGQASNDGMCRPAQYQEFVFVNGEFAGTLSPVLMNSRVEGSANYVSVPGDGRIVAEFSRYADRDPLCCPSHLSQVEYEIVREAGNPVVRVKNIKTRHAD